MKPVTLVHCTVALVLAVPALAEGTRDLDAHTHGHGALNIALEGNQIAIELEVPGFDIVGFEYTAQSDEDKAAVVAALETLGDPAKLGSLPGAAGCDLVEASVEFQGGDDHNGDHGGHDDHAAEGAEHVHDDHVRHGDDHAHHDNAGEDHVEAAAHSDFHAEYLMTCAAIDRLTTIGLPYFQAFPNSESLAVQLVTEQGAAQMKATPDEAVIDLSPSM